MTSDQTPQKSNLLADAQVRAEVVAGLYKLIPANPLVAIFVTALLVWQVARWPTHLALFFTLATWLAVNAMHLGVYFVYRRQVRQAAIDASTSAQFLKLFV